MTLKTILSRSIIVLSLLFYIQLNAQETSSAMNGRIISDKGEDLIGAVVQAVHTPTGSKYTAETDLNGRFNLSNLRPGGPYEITIIYVGYKEQKLKDVYLTLGNTAKFDVSMSENNAILEEVQITGSKDIKTGASTNISKEQLMGLPTLSRNFTDMTRLTPQASNNAFAGTSWRYNNVAIDGAINNDAIGFSPSLGGQSPTSNMPGSSTRTNSISLDAIEQVQVQIAPYDVKLGNFTGGSINAITRSGTNDVTGSVYGFGRNAAITGPNNAGDKSKMPSSYYDYQTGFRVGLPLIKNKLFFFTNEEITKRVEPTFYNSGQSGSVVSDTLVKVIDNYLINKYGYNPGSNATGNTQGYTIYSQSDKFFNRLDWNISDKHKLSLRNNSIISQASNLEESSQAYQFPGYDFVQKNVQSSTVMELKSRFNNSFSNNAILGFTTIHDYRDPTAQGNSIFPQIQINGVGPNAANKFVGNGQLFLGSNREAGIFNTSQKTFEFTDNLNWYKGNHSFTFGTHNEFYFINYGFINSWNGRYDFSSVSNFLNNQPSRVRATYNLGDNSRDYNYNNPSATFNINLLSAYVQDDWQVSKRLKVTPGIRIDMPVVGSSPQIATTNPYNIENPAANTDQNYGSTYTHTATSQIPSGLFGQPLISPRIGFNWDVKGDQSIVIRGGSGLFTGRIPFAWLGYAYYNNGVNFGSFDYKPTGPLPFNLPTDPTNFSNFGTTLVNGKPIDGTQRREIDLIDKNFKMPQNWRSNLAVDFKLPGGYQLTLEGIFTQVVHDVKLQMINLKDSVSYNTYDVNHQQPVYLKGGTYNNRVNNNFSNVYLLSNTNQGYRYSLTAQLKKTYKWGFDWMAAYTYGQSFDVLNGIRNSPESGWQTNQSLVANSPALTHSNFDIRSIIIASAGYKKEWSKSNTSYISLIFSGQSGSPFTYTNGNSISNSGTQVDLAYIPKFDANGNPDITLENVTRADGSVYTAQQQTTDLRNFIEGDSYLKSREGKFTERNEGRTPWNNRLDLRLMHDFNLYTGSSKSTTEAPAVNGRKHTIQVTFDIINFTNLLNPKWGYYYFVPNTINQSVDIGLKPAAFNANGTIKNDPITGKSEFTFSAPQSTYSIDQLASRFQCQLGLRYLF
jgi:hypothetical protein